MSIIALALRVTAVQALREAGTLAGANVFDSAQLALDQLHGSDPSPLIVVTSEDEIAKPSGRDINNGDRTLDLMIELALARVVPMPASDDSSVEIAQTDANLELALAVLSRQVMATLFGRGGGEWGNIFRMLSPAVAEFDTRRSIPVTDGVRYASRQYLFSLKAQAEPDFGAPPADGTALAKFLTKLEATPELAPHAAILREAVEGIPSDWPEFWTRAAVSGGYTEAEAAAIGIADLGGDGSEPFSEVTVVPDGITYSEEDVDLNVPLVRNE